MSWRAKARLCGVVVVVGIVVYGGLCRSDLDWWWSLIPLAFVGGALGELIALFEKGADRG